MRPVSLLCLLIVLSGIGTPLEAQFRTGIGTPHDPDPTVGWEPRDEIIFTNARPGDTLFPVNVNNWWGYMNKRGNLVVFPRFDWADDFYEGLARAVVRGRTGYIKGNGGWVHDPRFVYADRFAEGRAVIGDGEHFGYIEKSGDVLVPIKLDGALRFSEGLAAVMKEGKGGYINLAGDLEIPLQFSQVRSFHDGYAAVRWPNPDGGADVPGYIDRRGQPAFVDRSGRVGELGDFHDGLAYVRSGEKWGYLGKNWKLRIEARFDEARDFSNGVAAVRVGYKWGYIDKTGRFLIEPQFDRADELGEELAMVTLDGKVGYVGRAGKQGIPPGFQAGRPFFENYARVDVEPSFAYIDRNGNPVWDPREALKGFTNRTTSERAAIARDEELIFNRTIAAPEYREPIPEPYPPEHIADEAQVLPAPQP